MNGPSRSDAGAADLPRNLTPLEGRPRGVFVDSSGAPEGPRPAKPPQDELEEKTKKRAQGGSWWWAAAPLGTATLLTVIARLQPQRIEDLYSRKLYPKIGALLQSGNLWWSELSGATNGDLSARRPSLSEALLGIAVGVLLVSLIRAGLRGFGAFARRVLWIGGVGYFAFLVCWGLNHSRMPLSATLNLDVTEVSAEELNDVALELERDLSQLLRKEEARGAATERLAGLPVGPKAIDAWSEALRRDPRLGWQSEPTLCAPALSNSLIAAGISGIFSPFSQEAHVPSGLPETDLAFAACHEIAHVQGWAREDEANYLAWRVGSRSESSVLRKAALTLALVHVHRALRQANPILQKRRIMTMDVRIMTLLEARSTFWSKNRSRLASQAVQTVNDTYLKSQGQAGGVASYGRMVDLLVAELR